MHYSKVKPSCSTFRMITANFYGVRNFRNFTVLPVQKDNDSSFLGVRNFPFFRYLMIINSARLHWLKVLLHLLGAAGLHVEGCCFISSYEYDIFQETLFRHFTFQQSRTYIIKEMLSICDLFWMPRQILEIIWKGSSLLCNVMVIFTA